MVRFALLVLLVVNVAFFFASEFESLSAITTRIQQAKLLLRELIGKLIGSDMMVNQFIEKYLTARWRHQHETFESTESFRNTHFCVWPGSDQDGEEHARYYFLFLPSPLFPLSSFALCLLSPTGVNADIALLIVQCVSPHPPNRPGRSCGYVSTAAVRGSVAESMRFY